MTHPFTPHLSFDGGDLDCGSGLLLKIRTHIDRLESGQLLEILSTDLSVEEDLPAWCRLTKNELVSFKRQGSQRSFLIAKGNFTPNSHTLGAYLEDVNVVPSRLSAGKKDTQHSLQKWESIPPIAVCGIGSWPRPQWLLTALHLYLEGKVSEESFQVLCSEAVKECVSMQLEVGVDIVTDGELRRDNYASFVASKIENCQLIPLVDLLPLVQDPEKFSLEMAQLDVPAEKVRHPAVFGKIRRISSFCRHEVSCVREVTNKPIKISLPGPYVLTRTMWMDCIPQEAYTSREELARDIVDILREELSELLESGVEIVQFDEPVLTEVVFHSSNKNRTFMCGALSEKKSTHEELSFAASLLQSVISGFDSRRIALHICRGNWTNDETKALQGPYDHLMSYFDAISVGILFLEYATDRAGGLGFLERLKDRFSLGVGFVNQKSNDIESSDALYARYKSLRSILGDSYVHTLYLTPDCGFATFADSPLCSVEHSQELLKHLCALRDRINVQKG